MNIKRKVLSIKNNNNVKLLVNKEDLEELKEKQQQQKFFNKRKNKELKAERHQEKMREEKREKIMKKLNNQAKQDLLKQQAKEQGLFSISEIDVALRTAFQRCKLDWKKYFLLYFNNEEHSLEKIKVKGLYFPRFKKEEYLSKKKEFVLWLKKRLRSKFQKVAERFNATMDKYVIKYNDERFNNYKINL